MFRILFSIVLAFCALTSALFSADEFAPKFVPWPQKVELKTGNAVMTCNGAIRVSDESLMPLAKVLIEEISLLDGPIFKVETGPGNAGDIVLELNPKLAGESYSVFVDEKATIRAGTYGGIAMGTVSLLQSLNLTKEKASIPQMAINDNPAADFRGLLVDVARNYHSIYSLKQMVRLCRLYKIRYLHLHLTDDPMFMFPSTAYPQLSSKNYGGKCYTLDELKDLVAFADARYVTIIPEYEVPGHSGAAIRAMKDLLIIHDTKPYEHHASINFVRDDVMKLVETVVGEMCEVFKSSPYFHIGGDEADLALAKQNVDFQAAMKKHDLPDVHELYRRFVVKMNDIVKKNHKQTIVWEGFGEKGKIKIPTDIIVMEYEIRFYKPGALVRDGYKVINTSWTPLYVVNKKVRPPEEIYAWNQYQFKPVDAKATDNGTIVAPTPLIIGAELCSWEQQQSIELSSLRGRVPAMSERIWNPGANRPFADFSKRFDACDAMLTKLVGPEEVAPKKR